MDGMWWGTAIEAPDPSGLAKFYSQLLGWPIGHEEPGTAILAAPQGPIYIVFQQATDYQAPVWRSGSEGRRRSGDRSAESLYWPALGAHYRQQRDRGRRRAQAWRSAEEQDQREGLRARIRRRSEAHTSEL